MQRNFKSGISRTIQTQVTSFGSLTNRNHAGRRHKVIFRILRINTAFNSSSAKLYIILFIRQRIARSHGYHITYQIDTGAFFRHRMFHLQAGIHFQKIKILVRVPHDATDARLNLGFEHSFGKLHFRNVKVEKKSASLDMRKAANVGYADEAAGDGKGGWFDLGADEDAAKFNYRHTATFANVPYMALSPESNGGKSVLLIKPAGSPKMGAESAKIPLSVPQDAKYLYILNALETSERGEVGEIAIFGENGKSHAFKLAGGVDVAGWKNVQKELKNAAVGAAWLASKGYRKSNGLYSTRLEIPDGFGKVAAVEFRKAKVPWIVAAATLSKEKFPFPSECKFVTAESKEWKAVPVLPDCGVIEGSALDCSALWNIGEVKARVVASKDGHLELEDNPGVPVAFQTVADQGHTYNTLTATKESTEE